MADEEINDEELIKAIDELCQSKAEEFRLFGYEQVTPADVWECVSSKYKKDGIPPVHRLVNDILTLKATTFMNYLTLSAYRGSRFE
ncbi:post-transcriptional regulator [Paenibacillus physcomitrellae]|uniref:Histidine kinase n=1 Tax=Paenibacillus physcomitrellae TaxID=1619311 RepID=A0ABQ1GE88_9BACL|nr:post-transcriptional regulator [Paenibacillus physcomitrellae]GGA41964.1 histidine kinase [Paenibacillus physcomitrellae]